jgi:hypothetical protein
MADNLLSRLPIHEAASAYRKGASVHKHAAVHVAQNYLLKVDFQNFFPSITQTDIDRVLRHESPARASLSLTQEDVDFVKRIVCRRGALTIGAPSSPLVSNLVMYEFDDHGVRKRKALGSAILAMPTTYTFRPISGTFSPTFYNAFGRTSIGVRLPH